MQQVKFFTINNPHLCTHTDGHIVHTLVATGTVYKVDPYRVICKKIVLSGHPLKIHRKSAVVRYLFFNRGLCVCLVRCLFFSSLSLTIFKFVSVNCFLVILSFYCLLNFQ